MYANKKNAQSFSQVVQNISDNIMNGKKVLYNIHKNKLKKL